jgi:hypothetical protein
MNNILPVLNYWSKRLGLLLLTGSLLTISALTFYATIGRQAEQHLGFLKREVAQTGATKKRPVWLPESPQMAIQNYYLALPQDKAVPDVLEKIFDAAYENDVALDQGQFKQQQQDGVKSTQYQIVLPATGSYTGIRTFVNQVLLDISTIALDGISFSREDTKNPEVDATISFTLYLKASK